MPNIFPKIFSTSLLLCLLTSCAEEPEMGSKEWCEKMKDKKESEFTVREAEHMLDCFFNTLDENTH